MRHYEIVFLVHPDQGNQVRGMIDRYRDLIKKNSGTVHRLEDWGRRQLAYPIEKAYKAHYILMNVECEASVVAELENIFRFNDAIIRHLIFRTKAAPTEASPMQRSNNRDKAAARPEAAKPAAETEQQQSAESADPATSEAAATTEATAESATPEAEAETTTAPAAEPEAPQEVASSEAEAQTSAAVEPAADESAAQPTAKASEEDNNG